ncbi:MAG: twitching motility protein PilT, partial [Promethearchaeota archaeon]
FYQCTNSNCKKIYWKGTHIENIVNKLKKMNI